MAVTIDEIATFCKRKGFVYPTAEIYGGLAGFFDFGHLGVELKNNIKQQWWKTHVNSRRDVVGIDGSIITHPSVWTASGHVEHFEDLMKTGKSGQLEKVDELDEKEAKQATAFNLMFSTSVGPQQGETSKAYLRPETAQLIFPNFRLVAENARMKLPFGIAQIGKAFRNEISPRDFIFRCREFEQMEMEYFIHPDGYELCPYVEQYYDFELSVLTAEAQTKNKKAETLSVKILVEKKIMNPWHAYWLAHELSWFIGLGAHKKNFRVRQHIDKEKSHYATDTWDLEYHFPFGWKELLGVANRTDFDLIKHQEHSKKDLALFDEESKKKVIPHVVAEPSLGVERAFLVFLLDAYEFDKERNNVVLHFSPKLAPFKVAVFPLVSNKDAVREKAEAVFDLLSGEFTTFYDASGAIGRRYYRQDEIGTPYCITIDFDTLEDDTVTIRDRDSTKQTRVAIKDLIPTLHRGLSGENIFS